MDASSTGCTRINPTDIGRLTLRRTFLVDSEDGHCLPSFLVGGCVTGTGEDEEVWNNTDSLIISTTKQNCSSRLTTVHQRREQEEDV